MTPPPLSLVAPIWGVAELVLAVVTHAKSGRKKDRGSLFVIWIVYLVCISAGITCSYLFRSFRLPWPHALRWIGYGLFVTGVAFRWYAIFYLGRFFTPNVVIQEKHRLIKNGPYRFVRHPTYTGGIAAAVGLTFSAGNWLSLSVILIPIFAVMSWRIQIEEAALLEAFGEEYRIYMKRTKRLIPLIY